MKRNKFFALLLGLPFFGKAQIATCIKLDAQGNPLSYTSCSPSLHPKPINNQCPLCGTMALPYIEHGKGDCIGIDKKHGYIEVPCKNPVLVRCLYCNVAFYQDTIVAEKR